MWEGTLVEVSVTCIAPTDDTDCGFLQPCRSRKRELLGSTFGSTPLISPMAYLCMLPHLLHHLRQQEGLVDGQVSLMCTSKGFSRISRLIVPRASTKSFCLQGSPFGKNSLTDQQDFEFGGHDIESWRYKTGNQLLNMNLDPTLRQL